jgi:hypothetical protein
MVDKRSGISLQLNYHNPTNNPKIFKTTLVGLVLLLVRKPHHTTTPPPPHHHHTKLGPITIRAVPETLGADFRYATLF